MTISCTFKPLILIFDLDETLYCIHEKHYKDQADILSEGAKKTLSRKPSKGYIKNPELCEGVTIKKLKAIDRKSFAEIFNKIKTVINHYKKLESHPAIVVKILTKGSYDLKGVKNIFNKLYANNEEDLFSDLSVEYLNRFDLQKINMNKPDLLMITDKTHSGYICMEKANLIKTMFEENWKYDCPTLKPARVYLIDNEDGNTVGVKSLGFNALHWPTTLKNLNKKEFIAQKNRVLDEINFLIDSIANPKI